MARYEIQTHQASSGEWMGSGKAAARSVAKALVAMNVEHDKWMCPKRAVNMDTGKIVGEVGMTPEYLAFCVRVKAILAAEEGIAPAPTAPKFTASVIYRRTNADGVLETLTISQDVTDDVAEGGDFEHLADRLYWNHVHGTPGFFDIVGGGVEQTA